MKTSLACEIRGGERAAEEAQQAEKVHRGNEKQFGNGRTGTRERNSMEEAQLSAGGDNWEHCHPWRDHSKHQQQQGGGRAGVSHVASLSQFQSL